MATEKKRLELTTELVSMSGYFCTYWGYGNSELLLHEDMIEEDFEEGVTNIHPDYYWMYFDNNKYMEVINERTHEFMDEILTDLLKGFGIDIEYFAEGYNSPQFYNFRGDRHDFDIVADDFQPLLDYCLKHEGFEKFLKDNYSSRDGFMSFTANNVDDLLKGIEENDMTAWGAVLSFIIKGNYDRDWLVQGVVECLGRDLLYTEFVDYGPLDEFMEELKSNKLDLMIIDSEWQKALFDREIGNSDYIKELAQEMYRDNSVEEITNVILNRLEIDTQDSKRILISNAVQSVFNEIESHNLKFDF